MRRLLTLIITLLPISLWAQRLLNPSDYIYPVQEVARLYSANFGEIRPGHFHAGIDIKTDGVEGKPLVAVADGYISRIVVQAGGYGRAVYITLNNGQTVVYGHMKQFRSDLEQKVKAERYRRRSNSVDLWFTPTQYPVRQGDRIGLSGNSGSSGGPHLHFEIRDTKDQRLRNLVRERVIIPVDSLRPRFMKLHYVEIDTLNGVPIHAPMESYAVVREAEGQYRLTREEPLPVGRKGYFVAEVTDRRNGVHNTFAVWRLRGKMDGETFYEFQIDDFTHNLSRTCDAVSHYPLQLSSRNEVIRLAQLDGAPDHFFTAMRERGLIRSEAGIESCIELECEDDCGNISYLNFNIIGRDSSFRAKPIEQQKIDNHRNQSLRLDNFSLTIPEGALYESLYTEAEQGTLPKVDSGVVILSPAYRALPERTPLNKGVTVRIRTAVPDSLRLKAMIAVRNWRGRAALCGGKYSEGEVSVTTRTVGDWFVVADTLPPTIRTTYKRIGADFSRASRMTFKVADNFSGIASWRMTIDGEWVPCDRYPSQGTLVHHFDRERDGRRHRITLTVTDSAGNTTRWEGEIIR